MSFLNQDECKIKQLLLDLNGNKESIDLINDNYIKKFFISRSTNFDENFIDLRDLNNTLYKFVRDKIQYYSIQLDDNLFVNRTYYVNNFKIF